MNPITTARRTAGITQQALARKSGVSQPTLSQLERGKQGSLRTYIKLADALNVPIMVILPINGESPISTSRKPSLEDLLEPVVTTDLPVGNWSPTRLMDWLLCPAKGAWSTGIFSKPSDFEYPMNARASVGKATHAYADARLNGMTADEALLTVADHSVGTDPELWLPFIEAWDREVRPGLGQPQAVEQRFEFKMGGHTLTAVIDVVDQSGMIRDLKTTQRLPNAVSTARESLQGPIYTAGWLDATGEWSNFALDYLVAHKSGVEHTMIPVPVSQTDITRVTKQLDYAATLAQNPDGIVPNPNTKYGCTTCQFLSLCHAKFGTLMTTDIPAEPVAVL